ncbi:MAG: hypothetical protein EHM35_20195, partial [Planctomycetaceae bacterium]
MNGPQGRLVHGYSIQDGQGRAIRDDLRIHDVARGTDMNPDARNILLCLRYGIGDLITELPAITRLREVVPRATITALGAKPATEILDGDPRVDRVVSIQQWGIQHLGDPVDEQVRRQLDDWLRANQFDLILDPSHAANIVRRAVYESGVPVGDSDRACLEAGLAQGMDGLSAVK